MAPHSRSHLVWSLALVWLGVAGRALVDKLLALRGGGELVAAQAQLSNVFDLVSGVSTSGLGVGVTALIAQAAVTERRALMRAAVGLSALTSGAFALVVLGLWWSSGYAIVPQAHQPLLPWFVVNGVLSVASAIWGAALVGEGRLRLAFGLTAGGIGLSLLALLLGPRAQPLAALALAQTVYSVAVGAWVLWGPGVAGGALGPGVAGEAGPALRLDAARRAQLMRFVPAGLSIGLLSPLSLAVARAAMAEHLSWEAAGQVQALWRTTEWVTITVAGVLAYYVLPRLSRAAGAGPAFARELRHTLVWAVLPALAALALVWAALPWLQPLLYTSALALPRELALPFVLGDAARVLSWVYLYALYARASGRAIAVGELLSLPLFAGLLLALGPRMSITAIGWAWALTFVVYAAFNWLMASRSAPDPTRSARAGRA